MKRILFMKRILPLFSLIILLAINVYAIPPSPSSGSSGINTTYDANSDGVIDADKVATLNQNTTGTAAALVANPTDCAALGLATGIDASGNLTCGYAIGTDVPGISGTPTDEQIGCWELDGTAWKLKACGAKITYTEPASFPTPICATSANNTGACTSLPLPATADPTMEFKDSDNAAGTAKIYGNSSGGANDIIMYIGVEDSTGESTNYVEIDGVSETIDALKPVVLSSTLAFVEAQGNTTITVGDNAGSVALTLPNAAGTLALVTTEKLAVFNIPGTSDDGTVVDSYIPAACTITGWIITTTGTACSAVVDIWGQAYADFPPEVGQTIIQSEKPTLSSAQMNKDTSISGTWTEAVAADTILRARLDSSDCTGNIQVTLIGTK